MKIDVKNDYNLKKPDKIDEQELRELINSFYNRLDSCPISKETKTYIAAEVFENYLKQTKNCIGFEYRIGIHWVILITVIIAYLINRIWFN